MSQDVRGRKLDDLGRLVLPGAMRRQLGWKPGTALDISLSRESGDCIILRRSALQETRCSLCEARSTALRATGPDAALCQDCIALIKGLA